MNDPTARLCDLYYYPVKGLTPHRLQQAALLPGQPIRGDRLSAIENGPSDLTQRRLPTCLSSISSC